MNVLIPRHWQRIIRICMMLFVAMIAFTIPFLRSGLITVTWAYIWLPIALSYALSALLHTTEVKRFYKGKTCDINPLQRYISLLVGNALAVTYVYNFVDIETAGWLFGIYALLGIPVQLAIIGIVEGFVFCIRKHYNNKSI